MSAWIKYAPIPAAIVAVSVLAGAAMPILRSDPPPWANLSRIEKSEKHLVKKIDDVQALIVRGNLLGAWRACRLAMQEKDMASVYDNAAQISMLQSDYVRLVGQQYPLPPCP